MGEKAFKFNIKCYFCTVFSIPFNHCNLFLFTVGIVSQRLFCVEELLSTEKSKLDILNNVSNAFHTAKEQRLLLELFERIGLAQQFLCPPSVFFHPSSFFFMQTLRVRILHTLWNCCIASALLCKV